MKLELNRLDLEAMRVHFCDENGTVVDEASIMELVHKYANRLDIQYSKVYADLEKMAKN